MNDSIQEICNAWYEDNGRIGELTSAIWDRAFEEGRRSKTWLPEVTEQQVAAELVKYEPVGQDSCVVERLTKWFNDPTRDVPVKPTMHPDLEWLAKADPTFFDKVCAEGPDRMKYFYRYASRRGYCPDRISWAVSGGSMPVSVKVFTREEIQKARKHLDKENSAQDDSSILEAMKQAQAREAFAERDHLNNTLSELPDYETWFETHGEELTVRPVFDNRTAATVHEMYTHFRARLLDELRGAGVIGE